MSTQTHIKLEHPINLVVFDIIKKAMSSRQQNKKLETLMSSQRDHLEKQSQLSQDHSLSPAVVFRSCQIHWKHCCSSSRLECWFYYMDQSLHHQSWVSRILWTAVLEDDEALELQRKEITKHVKAPEDSWHVRLCITLDEIDFVSCFLIKKNGQICDLFV